MVTYCTLECSFLVDVKGVIQLLTSVGVRTTMSTVTMLRSSAPRQPTSQLRRNGNFTHKQHSPAAILSWDLRCQCTACVVKICSRAGPDLDRDRVPIRKKKEHTKPLLVSEIPEAITTLTVLDHSAIGLWVSVSRDFVHTKWKS